MVRWKVGEVERRPRGAAVVLALSRTRARRPLTARLLALPLDSRLRRQVVRLVLRAAFHELNRGVVWPTVVFHAEDAVTRTPLLGLDRPSVARGPEGVQANWAHWAELWQDMRRDPVEVIEQDDRMLVLCVQTGRGRDGLELREEMSLLLRWRDGEIAEHDEFIGWEAGRRALSP